MGEPPITFDTFSPRLLEKVLFGTVVGNVLAALPYLAKRANAKSANLLI